MTLSTQSENTGARLALGAVLGAWFLATALASSAGWFVTADGEPPLSILVAATVPIAVFAGAYALSERFRSYVRAGDPVLLTDIQSWRVLGGIFLVLMSFGMLPAAFALPAGWGDVAIGVTAPFVARAIAERGARAGRWVVGWQLLGVLDLVVAVGTGASMRVTAAAQSEQMVLLGQLPLSLIPTFAVPLFVILHLATLAQLRAAAVAVRDAEPRERTRAVLGGVD